MPLIIALIIFLGITLGIITFFLVKSIIAPRQVETLFKQLNNGKAAAVTRGAKQILAKNPRNVDAHYLLGQAYLEQDKPELALMELKAVNQIGIFDGYTKEDQFRKKIAALYERFNQPEEALKEYLLLIKLQPNTAENYLKAGELFEQRDKSGKAMNFYRKAISLNDRLAEAHQRLGYILYRSKKPLEARGEFEAAIKNDPSNYQSHFYLGKLQKENHDYVAALLSFEKAQRDQSLKIRSLIERGSCYMNMNNFDKAATELERAIKLSEDPSSKETLYARYFLSLCYEKDRRFDNAIEQWEKIYKRKPGFKDVAEKLSQYQDLRTDDHMKDYLTANPAEFVEICKAVTTGPLGLTIRDTSEIRNGCQIIAVDSDTRWRNAKKLPKLMWFLRVPESLGESTIRSVHEKMRKLNVSRGVIINSSTFSRKAIEYAESRPIDLVGKDELQKHLKGVDLGAL
ncbi:MAG: tetratricopeptide repeat protein [Spirochaetota bacterium]